MITCEFLQSVSVDLVDVFLVRAQPRRQDPVARDVVIGRSAERGTDFRCAAPHADVVQQADEGGVALTSHGGELHAALDAATPRGSL